MRKPTMLHLVLRPVLRVPRTRPRWWFLAPTSGMNRYMPDREVHSDWDAWQAMWEWWCFCCDQTALGQRRTA